MYVNCILRKCCRFKILAAHSFLSYSCDCCRVINLILQLRIIYLENKSRENVWRFLSILGWKLTHPFVWLIMILKFQYLYQCCPSAYPTVEGVMLLNVASLSGSFGRCEKSDELLFMQSFWSVFPFAVCSGCKMKAFIPQ